MTLNTSQTHFLIITPTTLRD